MLRFTAILLLLLLGNAHGASAGREVAYSKSGQFVVTGEPLPATAARVFRFNTSSDRFEQTGWSAGERPSYRGQSSTNHLTIRLDPKYLVATAERLKSVFNDMLNLHDPYRGKVYVNLVETGAGAEVTFVSAYDRPKATWNCNITVPSEIAPERLVRVLIQAMLFESTHRTAGEGGCEIPLWFTEGLVAHIDARAGETSLFEANRGVNTFVSAVEETKALSEAIGPEGCLTLEQLSWPGTLPARPEMERAFQLSSHAFVVKLLELQNGGRALGHFVRLLPRYQNWQFAFLDSLRPQFPSLLDIEKWWAVNSLHLGGKGAFEKWTLAASLERLDETLVLPIEKRTGAGQELLREEMDLRTLLTTMNFDQQRTMLARVISGLFGLELRAEPRVSRLVADYRGTLEKYVADRAEAFRAENERRRPTRRHEVVLEATLKQLEMLATLRKDFEILLPSEPVPEVQHVAQAAVGTP